ncbi:MAG: hypothetical protein H7240_08150, partial [Glaciimonas sp.]|nr:hypothetical protein [Glaciimonas sp.]
EPKSAMAQGLDTKASQATALQTLNAREAAKAPPSGFGNSSKDGAFTPSAQYSQNSAVLPTQQLPPVMQAPVYAPAYSGGGGNGISWGSAALGFMLGRATSHDSSRDYESNRRRDNAAGSSGNNDQFSAQNGVSGMTSNKESFTSARSPQSTGLALSLLRIVLWILLLSGTSWIVWRLFFKKKAIVTSSSTHYSLR